MIYMETRNGKKEMKNLVGWVGTVMGMIGSMLVALNNGMQDFGYSCFLVGSVAWLYVSIKDKNSAAIIQWIFFLVCNIVGLASYLK